MRNILLTAVLAGLVGCVGGIDTTNPDPTGPGDPTTPGDPTKPGDASQAKPLFDSDVYPILDAKCKSCHNSTSPLPQAPGFVAPTATDGYSVAHGYGSLVGDLSPSAPILSIVAQGHNGTSYTPTETSKITAWLAAELAARNAGAPVDDNSPGAKITKLQKEWSGCMTLTNFNTAKMATAWANMQTNDGNGNATCGSCHDNAEYNEIATTVAQKFFDKISQQTTLMSQYFTVDSVTAPTKIIMNTTQLNLVATAGTGHIGHRRFNLTNSAGMTALTTFYNATVAAKTAGTCGQPVLKN